MLVEGPPCSGGFLRCKALQKKPCNFNGYKLVQISPCNTDATRPRSMGACCLVPIGPIVDLGDLFKNPFGAVGGWVGAM